MRKTSEIKDFPYKERICCLIEVTTNGEVTQVVHHRKMDYDNVLSAYKKALNAETKLYYVWPGQYTSDLFEVDDLYAFSTAFNLK